MKLVISLTFFLSLSCLLAQDKSSVYNKPILLSQRIYDVLDISGDFKLDLESNSNVNQLPDGQVLASQKSGAHVVGTLNWSLGKKERDNSKPVWSWLGSAGKTEYFDSTFNNRESENLTFGPSLQKKYDSKSKRLSSTTKLQLRHDWLQSSGSRSLGFRTVTLGQMNIFKPKTKKWGYDAIVPVLGTDLEFRDYVNALAKDANSEKLDTLTPQLLLLAIGLKNKDRLKHKSTLMGLLRMSFSDVANQQYLDARLSFKHSVRRKDLEGELGLGWIHRIQDEYNALSRRDERYEFTMALQSYWKKDKLLGRLYGAYEDQASDFSSFVYENRKFGASLSAKF